MAAAANTSLSGREVISALLEADVVRTAVTSEALFFSTCEYLDKAKYFCLGFLDSPHDAVVVQRFSEFFRLFVGFLCADSEKDFTYKGANSSLTGWCKPGVIPGQ